MASPDRLTALDASFLHLEAEGAHMHVASVLLLEGDPPGYDELVEAIASRLHLVPRYRQRLAHVPFNQGRPRWVDDPHFNVRYHVRHSALPRPGSRYELSRLAGRLFAQPLDRTKPLWELSLVEGLSEGGWAIIAKTHHAIVDGVSGADLMSVLFDTSPDPAPTGPSGTWHPRPVPSGAQLLAEALVERATVPQEVVRGVTRAPRQVARGLAGMAAMTRAALRPAPPSPLNVRTGPHRRYTWIDADLRVFKAIKDGLGGSVNDVVLSVVALGLGRWLRGRGDEIESGHLRAMIPVSVRAQAEQGALGNRVAAMFAELPIGVEDPVECFREVHGTMQGLKSSAQAVGAQAITSLGDFAPPTILSQAARVQARTRLFNLVVTNVPGPQFPLYMLGRRLTALYPVVPLARGQALGIAVMSYDGRLGFGLLADFDALPDLKDLTNHLQDAVEDLAAAAGAVVPANGARSKSRRLRTGAPS